jgi:hypothetical protein
MQASCSEGEWKEREKMRVENEFFPSGNGNSVLEEVMG